MFSSARRILVPLLLAGSVAHVAFGQVPAGKDLVGVARELYASARYDEALAVLNDLRPTDATPVSDRRSIEQYRSLCLLALGRATEAEGAIAAVVTADPAYQPSEAEASPRVRAAFSEVRRRLLPDIATRRYTEAKAAFDRKDYAGAEKIFRRVLSLLDDPDMGGRLADLRILSSGFLDLSAAASAPPPEAQKKETVAAAPPAAPVQPSDATRIYTSDDRNVTAPVAVRQELPRVPPAITGQVRDRGVLELIIDELGRVTSMTIRSSVHPMYDTLLLTAAKDWRYEPAKVQGTPVRFRKMIQVNVRRSD
jgi:TonB family protein